MSDMGQDVTLKAVLDTAEAIERLQAFIDRVRNGAGEIGALHPELVLNLQQADGALDAFREQLRGIREALTSTDDLQLNAGSAEDRLEALRFVVDELRRRLVELAQGLATDLGEATMLGERDFKELATSAVASLRQIQEAAVAMGAAVEEHIAGAMEVARRPMPDQPVEGQGARLAGGAEEDSAALSETSEQAERMGAEVAAAGEKGAAGLAKITAEAPKAEKAIEGAVGAGSGALERLDGALAAAAAQMDDLVARTTVGEEAFGSGLPGAVFRSTEAIERLRKIMAELREGGTVIPPAAEVQLAQMASELTRATEEAQRFAVSQREARQAVNAAVPEYGIMGRTLHLLTTAIEEARAAGSPVPPSALEDLARLRAAMANGAEQAARLAAAQEGVQRALKAAGMAEEENTGHLLDMGNKLSHILFGFEAFAVTVIVGKLKEVGAAIIEDAEKMHQFERSLLGATGSEKAAGEASEFFRTEAQRLGFTIKDNADVFTKFEAVVRGSNMSVADGRRLYSLWREVGKELSLSQADINSGLELFQTVIDRGSISMAELRKRLEVLPGGMELLRVVTGKTAAEIKALGSSGELSAAALIPMIEAAADKYGSSLAPAIRSVSSEEARLNNEILAASEAMARDLLPAIAQVTRGLGGWVKENQDVLAAVGSTVGRSLDLITMLAQELGILGDVGGIVFDGLSIGANALEGNFDGITKTIRADVRGLAEDFEGLTESARHMKYGEDEGATSTDALTFKLAEQMRATLELSQETATRGDVSRETAQKIVAAINGELATLRTLDSSHQQIFTRISSALRGYRDQWSSVTIDLTKALADQVAATQKYASDFQRQLRETGSVSQGAADKIVKDVKTEVAAIEQLPPAEKAAWAERKAALLSLGAEFERFTTDYQTRLEEQVKAARKAAEVELPRNWRPGADGCGPNYSRKSRITRTGFATPENKPDSDKAKLVGSDQAKLDTLHQKPLLSADDIAEQDRLQARKSTKPPTPWPGRRKLVRPSGPGRPGPPRSKRPPISPPSAKEVIDTLTTDEKIRDTIAQLGPASALLASWSC